MKRLKKIMRNPALITVGLLMVGEGIHFMSDSQYFRWPPFLRTFENDDIVGFCFALFGICLILITLFPEHVTPKVHGLCLAIASFLMGTLSVVELLHWVFLGIDMPWMQNTCITVIIMIIAGRGHINDV